MGKNGKKTDEEFSLTTSANMMDLSPTGIEANIGVGEALTSEPLTSSGKPIVNKTTASIQMGGKRSGRRKSSLFDGEEDGEEDEPSFREFKKWFNITKITCKYTLLLDFILSIAGIVLSATVLSVTTPLCKV